MKKSCNECCEIFADIYGVCPECRSEDLEHIRASDICVICEQYHDTGPLNNYKNELEECFNACYRDGRAYQYIEECWSQEELDDNLNWLNELYTNRTLKECLWSQDVDEIRAFMRFVVDCETAERAEREYLYVAIPPLASKEVAV